MKKTEIDFTDKFLNDLSVYVDSKKMSKLERSKPFQKWLKFYIEWFGMKKEEMSLQDVVRFTGRPGSPMIFVPKELNLSKLFTVLREKCNLKTNIDNPDEEVDPVRRKKASYILCQKHKLTLMEECLNELFVFYTTGTLSPKQSSYSWSTYLDNKKISMGICSGLISIKPTMPFMEIYWRK